MSGGADLFGKRALLRGLITREQLDAALREQARMAREGVAGRPLGEILVAHGHLTEAALASLLEEERRRAAELAAESATARTSESLGQLAVAKGLCSAAAVNEALRLQEEMADQGLRLSLGEVLVRKGYLSAERVRDLLSLQRKTPFYCPTCHIVYNVVGYLPGRRCRCPECRHRLKQIDDPGQVVGSSSALRAEPTGPPGPAPSFPPEPAAPADLLSPSPAPPSAPATSSSPSPAAAGEGRGEGLLAPPSAPATPLAPTPPPLAAPTQVGRYELLQEIGRGAIDLVYKAWDTEARSIVALKLLREEFLDRPEVCAHYLTQAERHSRMVHPHVLEPRDFGEADGRVYVALDFVEGRSLEEWLAAEEAVAAQVAAQDAAASTAENADAGGAPPRAAPAETVESQMSMRLGTPQALRILRDVAAALGYAHERGLAHRGVRPSNILIDGHFEGFLGDFGMDPEGQVDLAAPATAPSPAAAGEGRGEGMSAPPSAPATSAAATPPPPPSPRVRPTWAPEQAAGRWSEVGARADVFALGVILYRILAGRPPFFGADDTELARAVRHDEPPPFRSASRYVQSDLKAVCLTCLEKEPALRYANGREVADELTRFFEGKRTIARPITRFQRWSRRVRRHAVVATLVVATVLSVLLLGGLRAYAARARADRVQQLLRAGRLREVGGNLRGALAAYKDASATDPANPAAEAEVKRATALLDKRAAERKLVEGTAEELAGVYRAEFWAEVGRARLDLMRAAKTAGRPYGEDAQRAETALDRAISLDDRCADALAARGLLNETLELYDQALNDYESADALLQGSSPDVRAAVERMRALFGHGFQK